MTPEPNLQPNNAEWLSKRDAARLLGVSERQIDRQAAAGRIRSRHEPRQPHQKAAPVFFAREDLEALRTGRPNYHPVVEKSPGAQPEAPEKAIVPVAPTAAAGLVLERLAHLLAAGRPAKPWLSISEAAEFSGLPAGFLRRIAPQLEAAGDAVNVSCCGRPRWKIRRDALEIRMRIASGSSDRETHFLLSVPEDVPGTVLGPR